MKRALLLCAATLAAALVTATAIRTANAGTPANNNMLLDNDAGTGGVQGGLRIIDTSGGTQFTIAIEQTVNPVQYQGFQWQIEFDSAVLSPVSGTSNDDGNPVWDADSTGFTLCAAPAEDAAAPAGKTWYGNGAGCVGLAPISFTGTLAQITLQCELTDASQTSIRFVTTGETEFGSTFLDEGGGVLPTDLGPSITIQCGVGTPPTPTETPTTAPTNTPSPTITPTPCPGGVCPTNTPTNTPIPATASPTLVPLRSTTGTATSTSTPGGPGEETPGAASPTQPGGGPGGVGGSPTRAGTIRPPDTGTGGDGANMLIVTIIGLSALVAGAAGGIMLWRGAAARRAK